MTRTQAHQSQPVTWTRTRRHTPERAAAGVSFVVGRFRGRGRDSAVCEAQTIGVSAAQWESICEPDLASVLADPIVALVMARDGLSAQEVSRVMRRARARLINGGENALAG